MSALYPKLISVVYKLQLLDIELGKGLVTGTKIRSLEITKNSPLLDYNQRLDVLFGGVVKRYNCGTLVLPKLTTFNGQDLALNTLNSKLS